MVAVMVTVDNSDYYNDDHDGDTDNNEGHDGM